MSALAKRWFTSATADLVPFFLGEAAQKPPADSLFLVVTSAASACAGHAAVLLFRAGAAPLLFDPSRERPLRLCREVLTALGITGIPPKEALMISKT